MVILTEEVKKLTSEMSTDNDQYCCYPDD